MRRLFLGSCLVVLGLAYAWLGSRAADPAGAPLLALPASGDESARWLVTQMWGISMTSFVAAGAAILLRWFGPIARSAIVTFGALSAVLLVRSFDQAAWTELAVAAGFATVLTFVWDPPRFEIRGGARRAAG